MTPGGADQLLRRRVSSRTKEWYVKGKLHRVDGPALHRVDDPAIEVALHLAYNNTYWLRGENISYSEWLTKVSKPKFEQRGSLAESLLGVRKNS